MATHPQQQFPLFDAEAPEAVAAAGATPPAGKFSNFIVYVDESGDHGMATLDPNYPVFVLAFCVFYKGHYSEKVVPALHKFKFNHFGHDLVVLHEHEIRKEKGAFRFPSRAHREQFQDELGGLIDASNFILISCVIDKARLRARSEVPPNPYHVALGICLETLYELLQEKKQDDSLTHVVVECRGKKEDDELEFRRICDGANRLNRRLTFDVVFADKKVDSPGLQLADLVARPIGLHVLRPGQPNPRVRRADPQVLLQRRAQPSRQRLPGLGLKVFRRLHKAKSPGEAHRGCNADRVLPVHLGAEYRRNFTMWFIRRRAPARHATDVTAAEIERVLDADLPKSYDRTTVKQKCDNIYDLTVEYAIRGKKWAEPETCA